MDIKKDIETREDIERFIHAFYEKVKVDDRIGIIFNEIVSINWEHHIPIITDFWESILLDNPVYQNNGMEIHYKLHAMYPLNKEHFEAWLSLFESTLDEMFLGNIAELAKKRAKSVASLMKFKMNIE
jgi:hemoglobin